MSFLDKLATHSIDLLTTDCLTPNLVNQKVLCVFTPGHRACLPHIYVTRLLMLFFTEFQMDFFVLNSYQKATHGLPWWRSG